MAGLLLGGAAQAQSPGCALQEVSDPPRQVLRCPEGLMVTVEKGASFRMLDSNRDGKPEGMALDGKAVLVDKPPSRRGPFQILTPHAVAAVRGTVWAVDVEPTRTSVFVRNGSVRVSARQGNGAVSLGAGEGVDVEPGRPLVVKRWPPERAARLLARLSP